SNDRVLFTGSTSEEAAQYIKESQEIRSREEKNNYKSGHWDEKNVLAHVRLNDRTDADGNKVLFVEEIQSDWHQEGRKKGYKGEYTDADKNRQIELRKEIQAARSNWESDLDKL